MTHIPIAPHTDDAPAVVRDIQHYMRPGLLQLSSLPPLSLYVHLPWCLKKCPYCDFNSHEARGGNAAGEVPEQRYIDALMADLEAALADLSCLGKAYFLRLRLLDRGWCSVSYRPDLDGAIEFSPENARAEVPGFVVNSPSDEFSWLHPASEYPFVLDGQYWRTADPRDWPWPLARVWQSQLTSDGYRRVMRAALLARFSQHDKLRRRLKAIQCPVTVTGVPDGLIEEVKALL